MKSFSIIILISLAIISIFGCDDPEAPDFNFVSFEGEAFNFGVDIGGENTEAINVYTTKITDSDRTFAVSIDSSSSADPQSYTIPSSVTIPANSNKGSLTVTVTDLNIGQSGKTLVLQLDEKQGIFVGKTITLNISQLCTFDEVILDFIFDDYPEETSWEVSDSNNVVIYNGDDYGGLTTLTKNLCLVTGTYTFKIFDVYEDGICCGGGEGSYTLTYQGNVLASGGEFAAEDSRTFTVTN